MMALGVRFMSLSGQTKDGSAQQTVGWKMWAATIKRLASWTSFLRLAKMAHLLRATAYQPSGCFGRPRMSALAHARHPLTAVLTPNAAILSLTHAMMSTRPINLRYGNACFLSVGNHHAITFIVLAGLGT